MENFRQIFEAKKGAQLVQQELEDAAIPYYEVSMYPKNRVHAKIEFKDLDDFKKLAKDKKWKLDTVDKSGEDPVIVIQL